MALRQTDFEAGGRLWALRQYEDALRQYVQVITEAPTDPQIYKAQCMQARCLQCLKRHEEALQVFDQVIGDLRNRQHEALVARNQDILDHLGQAIYLRGTVLFEMGRLAEAEEVFTRLVDQPWSDLGSQHKSDARYMLEETRAKKKA